MENTSDKPSTTGSIRPTRSVGRSERRNQARVPLQFNAQVTVLNGSNAGETFDVKTRDISLGGVCFLTKLQLTVGQTCTLQIYGQDEVQALEVVRSRQLSNGKYEIGAQRR